MSGIEFQPAEQEEQQRPALISVSLVQISVPKLPTTYHL